MIESRKQVVDHATAWLSHQSPDSPHVSRPAPTITITLAGPDERVQLSVDHAPVDGREVGVTALLARDQLQELINGLVMTRERWDQARKEQAT